MDWYSKKNGAARFSLLMALAFVVGASASAGTLYSWKTEDGTFAYTNEKKRIPARYKGEAKSTSLKSMGSYKRLTPGPELAMAPYAERIVERLEILRGAAGEAAVSSDGSSSGDSFVRVKIRTGAHGTDAEIEIPVGAEIGDDFEPVTVETVRVEPSNGHQATRHYRVVRQGDKVLAVIKAERNDGPLTPVVHEGDFGTTSLD